MYGGVCMVVDECACVGGALTLPHHPTTHPPILPRRRHPTPRLHNSCSSGMRRPRGAALQTCTTWCSTPGTLYRACTCCAPVRWPGHACLHCCSMLETSRRASPSPAHHTHCRSAAGACYIRAGEAPAKLVLRDVVEMCKGVQHPTRGLFLRAYLVQARACCWFGVGCVWRGGKGGKEITAGAACRLPGNFKTATSTPPLLASPHPPHPPLHPTSPCAVQVMRGLLPDTGSQYEGPGGLGWQWGQWGWVDVRGG